MGLICKKCGLPVTRWMDGWKHVGNQHSGKTPKHRQHTPVPMEEPEQSETTQIIDGLRARKVTRPEEDDA